MAYSEAFYRADSTTQYYVWAYETSSLYIRQWRVPRPVPNSVQVTINFTGEFVEEITRKKQDFIRQPSLRKEPIIRSVRKVISLKRTVRFDVIMYENEECPPFPAIYVPYSFLDGREDAMIQVVIMWNHE